MINAERLSGRACRRAPLVGARRQRRKDGFCAWIRGASAPLDTHIQNDAGYALDAAGVKRGALFGFNVTDATGEFNDAMMHFDTDRACRQGVILFELCDNLLLNLRVILHRVCLHIAYSHNAVRE
jgi:hypothetical protein